LVSCAATWLIICWVLGIRRDISATVIPGSSSTFASMRLESSDSGVSASAASPISLT
jgi:hypothetical protein